MYASEANIGMLDGKTIVVTGDLIHFPESGPYPQRVEFRKLVESHGGKLTSSISGKTSYLVCNNPRIATVKVQQAKEKGIPIITEDEFFALLTGNPMKILAENPVASSDDHSAFCVENGKLIRYLGNDQDITIPDGITDIGTSFKGNKFLRSITIPEGVTELADDAFAFCSNLKDISIPRTVKRIGQNAFMYCNNLRFANIPEGVIKIGDKAFAGLDKMRSVVIPSTVKIVGTEAFAQCESLTSLILRDGVENIRCAAFCGCTKLKHVTIPGSVRTDAKAFAECKNLTTLELKPGLTEIGESAFSGCNQLKSVEIPEGVTRISPRAFEYCKSLANLFLPESLLQICQQAFRKCERLKEVILPQKLQIIDTCAFEDCTDLCLVDIPESVTNVDMVSVFRGCRNMADENGFLIFGDVLVNVFGRKTILHIPEGIAKIADYALFYAEGVEKIIFPNTLKEIGADFWTRTNLRSLTRTNLRSLTLPESVTSIGENFLTFSKIETLSLNKNITKLPNGALDDCFQLRSLYAPGLAFDEVKACGLRVPATVGFLHNMEQYTPEQVAAYGKYAASQKRTIIPLLLENDDADGIAAYGELNKITPQNFDECFMQPALNVNATHCIAYLLEWKNKHITADVQEKLLMKELDKDPFNAKDMRKLWKYDVLDDGMLKLCGYKGLESEVIVPSRIGKKMVNRIEPGAFMQNIFSINVTSRVDNPITKVTISDGVHSIGKYAFRRCRTLKELYMPDSIRTVEDEAFVECTELEKLTLSTGLKEIGAYAFQSCAIREINLPEGLEKIGVGAFAYCRQLHTLKIPASLRRIESSAFYLTELTTVEIPEGVESVGEMAFQWCMNLKNVKLPHSLRRMERAAFYECSKMSQVEIPDGVEILGGSVFANCKALERIRVPKSVNKIGEYAFFNCPYLTIFAPAGSYAETYAKEHNIPFMAE